MKYRGIKQIGLLGVGFCGKRVAAVYEQITTPEKTKQLGNLSP